MKYTSRVFLGDLQRPFHDTVLLEKVERFLRDFQPDVVHFIGDVLDFYQLSDHSRDPDKRGGLFTTLQADKAWLHSLREAMPNTRFEWEDGNHEDRLRRYLWRQAPELADFPSLKLESLLGFEELGVAWRPYQQGSLLAGGQFLVVHGELVRAQSSYTAHANLDRYGVSGISGHTHRMGAHYRTNLGGSFVWYENGCLCSFDDMEYVSYPNWQTGFSIGYFTGQRFHVDQVPLVNDRLMYAGKEW